MGIKVKTEIKDLPCKLGDVEVQIAGTELANAVEAIHTEQDSQKEVKADLKARLIELNNKIVELASKVTHREEMRGVEVEISLDPNTMMVQEIRKDTGEIVTTRKAENDEMQTRLED